MAQSPEHYGNNWKVGDFIVDQNLSFFQANAVKYICRCEHKGDKKMDLAKAIHYLQHELENTLLNSPNVNGPSGGIPASLQCFDDWNSEADAESFDR
jgi:hypothetical protein